MSPMGTDHDQPPFEPRAGGLLDPAGDPRLEEALVRLGERERGSVPSECPRGAWVLERLPRSRGTELDEELVAHLASCPACRDLVLAFRQADDLAAGSISPRVEARVREALAARRPSHPPVRLLRTGWQSLAIASLAAGLLLVLRPLAFSRPLFDAPESQIYRLPPRSGVEAVRSDRLRLQANLRARAFVHAGIAYTLGDEWSFEWIQTGQGPEPRERQPGSFVLAGDIPEGAITARCVLLAVREPLESTELESIQRLVRQRELDGDAIELLARSRRGESWVDQVLPDASPEAVRELRTEVDELLASSAARLRGWVREHPERAAAAVAELLQEAIGEPAVTPDSPGFARAERIAREWAASEGSEVLLERVATYRRWAASQQDLERKRELDRRIRRDLAIHDQNDALMLVLPPEGVDEAYDASVRFYEQAAADYRVLGDSWGEIESLLRRALFDTRTTALALEQVLELSAEHGYPRAQGLALNLLAFVVYQGKVPFDELRRHYERAWDFLEEVRQWEVLAVGRSNFGLDLMIRGATGQAFEFLEQSLRIQQTLGFRRDEAYTLYKLAWAHSEFGRAEAGLPLALRAIRLLRECAPAFPGHALIQRPLARAHWAAALVALASDEHELALDLAEAGVQVTRGFEPDDPDDRSRCWNVAARARLALGDLDGADETAGQAFGEHADPWQQGQARATQGLILGRQGRWQEALIALAQARELLGGRVDARFDLSELLLEKAELEERHGLLDEALRTRLDWVEIVEELLALNDVNALDRAFLLERFRPGFLGGLRLAQGLQASGDPAAPELALRFLEAARGATGEPIGLAQVRDALPERALLLEYLLGDERSQLLLVGAAQARLLELPVTRLEAEERLRELESAIRDRQPLEQVARASRAAFEAFLEPVSAELRRHELVLVSPDPGLATPLFEVFSDGDGAGGGPHYLLLEHALAYAPSARHLIEACREPLPGGQGFLGLDALPASERSQEVERIAELFREHGIASEVLSSAESGERFGELARNRYVHVQAHVHDSIALELQGPDSGAELLEVTEVAELPRIAAELLVLSAGESVETGSSAAGLAGLPEAFLARGARTVISETGAASPELLLRFYGEFLAGQPKAEALRRAKLSFLSPGRDPSREDRRHPSYWALPILSGDPR